MNRVLWANQLRSCIGNYWQTRIQGKWKEGGRVEQRRGNLKQQYDKEKKLCWNFVVVYQNIMYHIPEYCNINTQIWSTQTVNMQLQTAKLLTGLNVNTRVSNTMYQAIWKHIPSDHKNLLQCCALKCIAQCPQWTQEPSGMSCTKMYGTISPVTTRNFWDAAHQNVQHIPNDHKNLLGCCTLKCIAHPQWPQEPSGMLHTKIYSTSPVTTRTFWDAAH